MITNVDVILCCFNQQDTIEKALHSIFLQDTCANIHLIVADDCSTDGTLEIIKGIIPPSNITLEILDKQPNMGISKNYLRAFKKCAGEYLFIIEGDDWWLPNHIQQHIDFLEAHQECSMSANNISMYNVSSGKISYDYYADDIQFRTYTMEEQIWNNRLWNLSACCFRVKHICQLPEKLSHYRFADWLLGMIMSEYGLIAILPGTTSVWRITNKGSWSKLNAFQIRTRMYVGYSYYNKFFDYKYNAIFKKAQKQWTYSASAVRLFRKLARKFNLLKE